MAKGMDEAQAERVLRTLEAEGLIDGEGVLTIGARGHMHISLDIYMHISWA